VYHPADQRLVVSFGHEGVDAQIVLDIILQNRVEHLIRREGIRIFLIRPQFGGRRSFND
jgi:hypothetical protein